MCNKKENLFVMQIAKINSKDVACKIGYVTELDNMISQKYVVVPRMPR